MNIAVTGGFGSGKSSVSRLFANVLDAPLLDADELCRQQLLPGRAGFLRLMAETDNLYLGEDGGLDRAKLREDVFCNPELKKTLEDILHPLARRDVTDSGKLASGSGKHLVVEVPLLYETGWHVDFDISVVVYVAEATQYARVFSRDGYEKEQVSKVLAAQMSLDEKCKLADFIVDNTGTFAATMSQVRWFARSVAVGDVQVSM